MLFVSISERGLPNGVPKNSRDYDFDFALWLQKVQLWQTFCPNLHTRPFVQGPSDPFGAQIREKSELCNSFQDLPGASLHF